MDTRTLVNALSWAANWHADRDAFVQAERDVRLSYAEVQAAANGVAAVLSDCGVEAGDRVAFLSRTTVEHAIAFFGVQRLGAIPVTLHVRESDGVLAELVDHVDPTVLVSQSAYADTASAIRTDAVESALELGRLDEVEDGRERNTLLERAATVEEEAPDVDVRPDDVAFIVLSSGSTGRPKGVVHTHEEAIEGAHLGQYKLNVQNSGTYLVQATPSFVGWAMLLFPVVNTGARAVFLEHWDPKAVLSIAERESLDLLLLVSTQWKQVLKADPTEYDTSSVRHVIYTGEPIGPDRLAAIRSSICDRVYTVYSSTEALNAGTVLLPEHVTESTLGSVGRPVPNTDLRLIDPGSGDPNAVVERGAVGEVVLRGPPVASNLWGDEHMADLFHPDGWWFSGDLGRIGDEGFLTLVGRADNMIISGGVNIYPERVEEVLEAHPDVEEAAVVGTPDDQWGERVEAFVVSSGDLQSERLDVWCLERADLSDYQRPRRYEFVDRLPRTSTGKLDRTSLRED